MYPYIRHTIPGVRLAVVKALHTFATAGITRSDWMHSIFFSLLFQNLVLEERADIRETTFATFTTGLAELKQEGSLETATRNLDQWYGMVMTPIGSPMNSSLFERVGTGNLGHNVDKPMMAGDLSLVSMETMLETRIAAAKALARLRGCDGGGETEEDVSSPDLLEKLTDNQSADMGHLQACLSSASAHKIFLASVIIQEWAIDMDAHGSGEPICLGKDNTHGAVLAQTLVKFVESPPPATYHEMSVILQRIQAECQALLNAFTTEGKVSKDKIPTLPTKVDPLSSSASVFSLSTAQTAIGPHFDALLKLVKAAVRSTALPSLQGKQRKIMASIGYFSIMKERYDIQVSTAVCGALIALRVMPAKFGPVVKSVMDGVRVRKHFSSGMETDLSRERRMKFSKSERPRALLHLWTFAIHLCSSEKAIQAIRL